MEKGTELGGELEKRRALPEGKDGRVDAAENVDKPALFEVADQKPAEEGTSLPPLVEKDITREKLEWVPREQFVGLLKSRL